MLYSRKQNSVTSQGLRRVSNNALSVQQCRAWDQVTNPGSGPYLILSARMLLAGGHSSSGRSLKNEHANTDESSMHIPQLLASANGNPWQNPRPMQLENRHVLEGGEEVSIVAVSQR